MRLRAYSTLPSLIDALRIFPLSCVTLLQLKGNVCSVCALQLTVHPCLSPLFDIFYKAVLHGFFLSFVLSHWLHNFSIFISFKTV